MLSDSITDRSKDGQIIQFWRIEIDKEGIIPVRSGDLFSTILSTMKIHRIQKYQNRYWMICTYEIPSWMKKTGAAVKNPQHSPPSKGYGKHPSEVNKRMLPSNVSLLKTGKSTGLYALNDPHAMQSPQDTINQLTSESMYNIMLNLFKTVLIKVYL
jgi:hypothetical protein